MSQIGGTVRTATEADVKAAILNAASENSSLLVQLSSTSQAPSLLANHLVRVNHLKEALSSQNAVLETLKEEVDTKFKRHKTFRDSRVRRFLYNATNMLAKFDAKAMKEEREYFALLNSQSKGENRRLALQQDHDEAQKLQEPLEVEAKEHEATHGKIDALYEDIFAGPTAGFPREDEREHKFYTARRKNEDTKETILAARRVLRVLQISQKYVKRAKISLGNAEQHAVDSILFFDDAILGLQRANNYISYAANSTSRVEENFTPSFMELVAVKLELDALLHASKIRVREAFSRDTIISQAESAMEKLSRAEETLEKFMRLMKEKESSGLKEIKATARELEDTRQELEQFRRGIFESVAGFGEAAPSYSEAPSYTECCDRMENCCEILEESHEEEEEQELEGERSCSLDGVIVNGSAPPPGYQNIDNTSIVAVEATLGRKE